MILFALAGYAGTRFLGIPSAFPLAVLLGLLIAPMVPMKAACSIRTADDS